MRFSGQGQRMEGSPIAAGYCPPNPTIQYCTKRTQGNLASPPAFELQQNSKQTSQSAAIVCSPSTTTHSSRNTAQSFGGSKPPFTITSIDCVDFGARRSKCPSIHPPIPSASCASTAGDGTTFAGCTPKFAHKMPPTDLATSKWATPRLCAW